MTSECGHLLHFPALPQHFDPDHPLPSDTGQTKITRLPQFTLARLPRVPICRPTCKEGWRGRWTVYVPLVLALPSQGSGNKAVRLHHTHYWVSYTDQYNTEGVWVELTKSFVSVREPWTARASVYLQPNTYVNTKLYRSTTRVSDFYFPCKR